VIGQRHTVVIARPLGEQSDRLESAASSVFLGIPLALIVAAAGGYLMAKKSLQPVTTMSAKAREISAATLTERIAVGNERDELGFLATTLNDLLERMQRVFDSQKRFMADASHELRTPLSIIQGEADVALARRDRSAEEYRQSVEVMQKASLKLTRIVQNLFLLARTDAGAYPMNCSRFYLDELIAESVRSMRSVAAGRGVELSAAFDSDLLIVADEELINRMLLNLVENAVKFTPRGGHVRVEARGRENRYEIRVADDGEGIAEADRGRIFDRFFRGDRTRQSRAGGAGLGLPIARWIAEAHGGSLVLERSDATGSTFLAILPGDAVR
jgi:two-component system, OmpR family, sensor kinase